MHWRGPTRFPQRENCKFSPGIFNSALTISICEAKQQYALIGENIDEGCQDGQEELRSEELSSVIKTRRHKSHRRYFQSCSRAVEHFTTAFQLCFKNDKLTDAPRFKP
jgi:hypothetical protein